MDKIWSQNLERQLVSAFVEALKSLPTIAILNVRENVRYRTSTPPVEADAIVQIEVNEKPVTLLIEAKSSVFPRDARELIWQLRSLQKAFSASEGVEQALPVIASRSLSDGTKSFRRSENVGYFEEGGSLHLANPNLYILLEKPPSKRALQTSRTLFSGRRSQVLHALLQQPGSWQTVRELSEKAFVSASTVSQVLVELEKREWVSSRGSGPHKERQLQEPNSLLDAWSKHVAALPKPPAKRFFVPSMKAEELMNRIGQIGNARGGMYAITGEWAAQIYAPFLSSISQVRCRYALNQSISEFASELNASEVNEGSNLVLLEPKSYGEFLFREEQRGIWLASPIVVYLDLAQGDGRAKEMAEHLRRERIRF